MTLLGGFIAIILAFAIGALFFYGLKISSPWGTFWSYLLVLILVGLAAEVWVMPIGPPISGESWLGAFLVILFFAILIAAATPPNRKIEDPMIVTDKNKRDKKTQLPETIALGAFFWLFLILMSIAAIWGILYTAQA